MTDPLEQALSATPIAPPARKAYRAELRARFLAGAEVDREPASTPVVRGWRSPLRLLAGGGLAAAAALFLLWILSPAEYRFEVLEGTTGELVRVDGKEMPTAEHDLLEEALAGAQRVETLDSHLKLRLADRLRLDVRPGTTLEGASLRVSRDDPVVVDLASGEVYVRTLDAQGQDRILVRTPVGVVTPTGTIFGIESVDERICVCVDSGDVWVERASTAPGPRAVGQGHSCVMYVDEAKESQLMDFPSTSSNPKQRMHVEPFQLFTRER